MIRSFLLDVRDGLRVVGRIILATLDRVDTF
jgi:hypothetical protein